MKFKPLSNHLFIEPMEEEQTTKSGIVLPDTVDKEKSEQGTVIAVGQGKWNEDGDERIPLSVKVGDKVMFSKYGYDEVKVDGVEYYIVSESNILAVIK